MTRAVRATKSRVELSQLSLTSMQLDCEARAFVTTVLADYQLTPSQTYQPSSRPPPDEISTAQRGINALRESLYIAVRD